MTLGSRTWHWWALYSAIGVVAFAVRLAIMLRGGGLLTLGAYDDGVYYAAADALVHGRLPYRDFLFLQPPGVVLAGAPFAWFGSLTSDALGLAVCRVAFMLLGAVNTVLVAAVLRRFGYLTAAVGGFFYAITYIAAYSERSILLEPMGTTGILVALAILARPALVRRTPWAVLAGVALGVACGFKIWYAVPVLIIVAFAGRAWWRMLVGVVLGATAVCLPFFVRAPAAMVTQVVQDQTGRGRADDLMQRLQIILGNYRVTDSDLLQSGVTTDTLTGTLAALTIVLLVIALTVRGARLYPVLFIADVAMLLVVPSFYPHYAALTTPMTALVVGLAVGRIAAIPSWSVVRGAIAGVAVVGMIGLNAGMIAHGFGIRVPVAGLTTAAAKVRGCVMSDDPTILASMDVLSRDLADSCALQPDLTGWIYDADTVIVHGEDVPRLDNPLWQKHATTYLTSGAAAIVVWRNALDRASTRTLSAGPALFRDGRWVLRETVR
ncbi:MAG TPA: hypothetical protein VJR25_05360 [Microbacterium sp.]|uniref:hypothetical protein n=1 Tax=Microbacterium sp. TaxID=51671 RepID=UPI002B48E28D|nr:hypothetical protein [Microbacterium sp.]HKT56181.1 hypothetical protein [Microbacterium sp.]